MTKVKVLVKHEDHAGQQLAELIAEPRGVEYRGDPVWLITGAVGDTPVRLFAAIDMRQRADLVVAELARGVRLALDSEFTMPDFAECAVPAIRVGHRRVAVVDPHTWNVIAQEPSDG